MTSERTDCMYLADFPRVPVLALRRLGRNGGRNRKRQGGATCDRKRSTSELDSAGKGRAGGVHNSMCINNNNGSGGGGGAGGAGVQVA